ncbi:MAG TPA: hypothetical protein VK892_05345 [Pyrinomonadaceae bacterium]|nr:hypothetical protein [Pyrinomonadaceae bacterium]
MRRLFIIGVILSAFSVALFGQNFSEAVDSDNSSPQEKAEKIEEFGGLSECDLRSRIDNLLIQLQEQPNATGYIIFYQGKDTLPAEYEFNRTERLFRMHIRQRHFNPTRLVFVDGGFRESHSAELWIVPPGAESPTPTNTIPKPEIPTDKTFLYDRDNLSNDYEDDLLDEFILPEVKAKQEAERMNYEAELESEETDEENAAETETQADEEKSEDEEAEIEQPTSEEIEAIKFSWANERFGELIENRKDSTGVIIFYADDAHYDVGRLQSHIEEGKRRIVEASKISPAEIQVIFGGYRHSPQAEFWIVPKKGEFPVATPEERPIEEISEDSEN